MSKPLIESIELFDIGPFPHFRLDASSVVVIKGDNGTGKTTLLNSLLGVFDGGHNRALVRIGADEGRCIVRLTNGTTINIVIREKTTERKITTVDGSVVKNPAGYLKSLASGFSLNPTGLIDASPKERVPYLLKALQVTFWRADIDKALGEPSKLQNDSLTLEEFDRFRDGKYSDRTDANRTLKELQGARKQMAANLPAEDATDWSAQERELARQLSAKKAELNELLVEAEKLRAAEVAAIRVQEEAEIEAIREKYRAKIAEFHQEANAEVAKHRAPLDADIERLSGEHAAAKEQVKAQAQARGAREALKTFEEQLRVAQSKAAKLDSQVEGLDRLKKERMDQLPFPGVEIRGDKILVNGKDFDTQLNTAEQMKLSLQVASMNIGDLPAMICDRGESLSEENLELLTSAVREAGMQLFIARVESGEPLTVCAG